MRSESLPLHMPERPASGSAGATGEDVIARAVLRLARRERRSSKRPGDARALASAILGGICLTIAIALVWLGRVEAVVAFALAGLCWWGFRAFKRADGIAKERSSVRGTKKGPPSLGEPFHVQR